MGSPSVSYRMLADGYEVESGSNGFKAQASFLCGWADAFVMHDEIMGYATASVVGPLSFNTPWQFPGAPNARLYASSCKIKPIALDGNGNPITAALGMAPGEFWSHARLDVVFETPTTPQTAADDPGGRNQLDPANPIYGCEQSVRVSVRHETRPKEAYKFTGVATTVTAPKSDITVLVPESRISLRWNFVPFAPWQKYHAYVGSVNDAVFLDCAIGTLLFEGATIDEARGAQGNLGKSLALEFILNTVGDWNKEPRPDTGALLTVETVSGAAKPYAYTHFQDMML